MFLGGRVPRKTFHFAIVLVASTLVCLGLLAGPAKASVCDRACLGRVLDTYLDAMRAHDPSHAPMAATSKVTEDGKPVALGQGVWAGATGLADYRIRLLDPRAGQAGFLGVVTSGGTPTMVLVRLKAAAGMITEVETITSRGAPDPFVKALGHLGGARAGFSELLAPPDRVPRERMIAAANSYYDGIEAGSGQPVAFADDCHRIENGVALVNNPDFDLGFVSPEGRKLPKFTGMGCREQFDTGVWATDAIADRRFPLVDEKTGVVAAFTVYRNHAKSDCAATKDYGKVCSAGPARADLDLVELFKIRGGKIHEMESVWSVQAPGFKSGW